MTASLRRRALLIGTENHNDARFDALPSVRADTELLRQVLGDRNIGEFTEIHLESDLSADEMRRTIATFLRDCQEDELALLYISGHGARPVTAESEFFFVTADTDYDEIGQTGVGAEFINECLEDCWAAQKIAILDCCRSGGFARGFRTSEPTAKSAQAQPETRIPLAPRGVYVLSSSGAGENSFAGGGTAGEPEPSVFTAAIIETLRTGSAGSAASGHVSVDELFEAVGDRLRQDRALQTPVKSAFAVNGRIDIARRPHGKSPELTPVRRGPAAGQPVRSEPAVADPDWPTLLAYYRDAVLGEADDMPLLPVADGPYVCLPGAERLLTGTFDEDGCIAAPPEADTFLKRAEAEHLDIWTGWPAVVLPDSPRGRRSQQFAPLLVCRVAAVPTDVGTVRLKPSGPVIPHPGLARSLLDDDQAKALAASYQPSWYAGESGRLADDAGHLLREEFELPLVEELRPQQLSDRIDIASPGPGARNVAVLLTTTAPATTKNLLKDLAEISEKHHRSIAGTALAALLPSGGSGADAACPPLVTPLRANPAQREVLRSAMTRRLTVATGPPGTGKSQVIVNAVATAIAAGQTVLVASTNNEAVNEVWKRCEELVPGSLIRTGSRKYLAEEATGLQTLLTAGQPDLETSRADHRIALQRLEKDDRELSRTGAVEADLHRTGRDRIAAEERVDHSADELSELLGRRWGRRARRLAGARLFGEWRRRRFLSGAGLPSTGNSTASTCADLADLADLDEHWKQQRRSAASIRSDSDLTQARDDADNAVEQTSTELLRNCVRTAARSAEPAILALAKARAGKVSDWGEFQGVLRHICGWALTCLSARRIPPNPALFHLVIIDEASQCSIPAVVPLLFRAKRALIIGDVMQLPHISTLPAQRDAELRRTHNITSEWLDEHRMSVRRHSSFHAAERAAGGSLLLDEHYRCHPEIAAVSNELFYGGRLAVLTDICGRPTVEREAVSWESVRGRAVRGPAGRSWYNTDEVDRVVPCVDHLLAHLPRDATLGVITPYRAQVEELERRLRDRTQEHGDRIRIGTVHAFQGGERDVIVLSLVASPQMPRTSIDWADRQHELWNVAITRARSHLVVVGDGELWERRGGVGAALLRATHTAAPPAANGIDTDLTGRLLSTLRTLPDSTVKLGVGVHGHRADALVTTGDGSVPVVLDPGAPQVTGIDPVGHLRRMLRRRELLSVPAGRSAVRLPAWILYDSETSIADRFRSPT